MKTVFLFAIMVSCPLWPAFAQSNGIVFQLLDSDYDVRDDTVSRDPQEDGACCIDNVCEFTSEEQPCLDAGGTWYEGETCPEFECPPDPCVDAIWHNGEPDGVNGYVCDRRSDSEDFEAWIVANVQFSDQVRIGGLHWWAVTPYSYDWLQTGDFIILHDAGDQPGAEIYEEFDVPNSRVDTGLILFGYTVYAYTFEIDITLPAGTYWFGMRPVNQGDDGQNFWLSAPYDPNDLPLFFRSEYFGMPDWVSGCDSFECVDVAFCITGWEGPGLCEYIPGDCNHNGNPLELEDVIAMIGMYRGSLMPPYECYCPPHGDDFTPTADPNGNCVALELGDVVIQIAAYRGTDTASGCQDCPGSP